MQRVGIYCRVSTQEEKQQNAFEIQKEELTNYVNSQNDWQLVATYEDKGISGTTSNRNGYQKMLKDIEYNNVDIIVIKDEYRLNRNTLEGLKFLKLLIDNDVKLFFYLEKKWYDKDKDLDIKIKLIVAEEQSKDLSKKINNAHKTRMQRKRICTNGRLWGYNQIDGQLIIDEEQAKVVRYVFNRYAEGLGFRKIQQELKQKGITNQNGNDFSMTTLKRMIRNTKYKGTVIMNTKHKDFYTKKIIDVPKEEWVIIEDGCPAIIDKETWEKANQILESKRRKIDTSDKSKYTGYFNGKYIYSGKIICGKCGKPYWHQKYTSMKHDLFQCSSYRTFGKNSKNGCDNPHIYRYVLDNIMKNAIYNAWNNKDNTLKIVLDALNHTLSSNNYTSQIKTLEQQINKANNRKNNLFNMRMDGEITKEEFAINREKLENEIDKLKREIDKINDQNKDTLNRKERIQKIEEYLNKKVVDKQEISEEIIEYFLDKIIVYDDKVKVYLINNQELDIKREDVSFIR